MRGGEEAIPSSTRSRRMAESEAQGRKDADGCRRAERFRNPMRAGKECFEALVPKPEPTVLGAPEDGCPSRPQNSR